ncbi:uncharacterized protein J4E87_000799 [Alternaria ethzedia]|uniref:uncharacterized protein n=1 Tax=Alternaria ethzedia TaxID=181014 RepID=UPI0020C271FB|nr:uncharacterized protein J4E87_000799 [Alternaria ethzedia]KAI4635842.1 hypothetical protein J4E87_000799 [Alternaria ethzedia]
MLSALKRTSIKHATLNVKTECMLCGQQMTLRALQKHLGRHQQQLALFALPANSGDDEDDEQDLQEDVQGDDNSDPSSKSAAEDGDVDLSDASELEQIRPPLATELDMEPTLREYLDVAAEEKLRSYDTNAEPSTKFDKTVRENSSKPVNLGEIPSMILDPPPSIPHQEIAEPHIADLESNLEKMEDTVASTEVKNAELEERLRAYNESLAGLRPAPRRDHTTQGYHTGSSLGVDKEVNRPPLIETTREMNLPEEERLDRIEPLVSMLTSRTSDLTGSAAESDRSIHADKPVDENQLPHATEYDQARDLDGGPFANDDFPNDGSLKAFGPDFSDGSDGLLLSPQSQQPSIRHTDAAVVIPEAKRHATPRPLPPPHSPPLIPPPRYLSEGEIRKWSLEDIMANVQVEQMRKEQLAVTREDAFKNEPAVESSHASSVDPKTSVGTSESTRVLPTGSGPTLPSSQADRRQPEDRSRRSRRESRVPRDCYDDRIVEVPRPLRRRAYSSNHYKSDQSGEERKDNAPKQSGDANRTGTAPTVTSDGHKEIRLKVDPNAPLSLQFNGDMEGRTMQLVPTEDGMAELVITGGRDDESTYYNPRESDMGDGQALISREQLEALIQGQPRGQLRPRREPRVVVDRTDREVEARPRRPSRPRRETRVNPASTDRGEGKSSVEEEGHARSSE